jgi:hypothetical protein
VSIEYVGEDAVFDVCLREHHTLFAGHGTPYMVGNCDECQDMDIDVLPIIQSCLDASPFKIEKYSGTPKTFDNPLEIYWSQSSQGIWHIPCTNMGCGYENVCCYDSGSGDILKMIGDNTKRRDGSIRTLICAKCGGPLDSSLGFFVHSYPERRRIFAGYKTSQIITPMHYGSALSWDKILDTMKNKPKFVFFNEVLAESYDSGQKLITMKDLKSAARGPYTSPSNFDRNHYVASSIGVDWGGKGREKAQDSEEFISNTALALAGIKMDGVVEITWGYMTPYSADHFQEAGLVKEAAGYAGVDIVAHDFTGSGAVMENIMTRLGINPKILCPFNYMSAPNKQIVSCSASAEAGVRRYWALDKARSLLLLCELIKCGKVIFCPYEGRMGHLMDDFLHIYEEIRDSAGRGSMPLVQRMARQHDDFVHACNFAVMSLYHRTQFWPNIAQAWHDMKASDYVASDGTAEAKNQLWLPSDVR